jgi:phosphate ABC transporter phosphate-binding protein
MYESIGSSAGIQRMTEGIFDFACTDAPLNVKQIANAKAKSGEVLHIPLVMGAVVPVYNLDKEGLELTFSGSVLADIFAGRIKKWNEPALQELNPKVKLPDKEIMVVHRLEGSGTTYILTDYFSKVSPNWKKEIGTGTSVTWPVGEGKSGNDGVVSKIKETPYSMGYLALGYAIEHKVNYGSVANEEGSAVKASLESVIAAAKESMTEIPDNFIYSITNAPGKDSYPISGTVWAVFYTKHPEEKRKSLTTFLRWATHQGQAGARELNYAPLPEELVKRIDSKLDEYMAGK